MPESPTTEAVVDSPAQTGTGAVSEEFTTHESMEQLRELIDARNGEACAMFLHALDAGEVAYVISHLGEERHTALFGLLAEVRPELAADLMEHFADEHAADLIDELTPEHAAAIFAELPSDDRTDLLAELETDEAEAILDALDPTEAASERERLTYDADTAGGLMITEVLAYDRDTLVGKVVDDLRTRVNDGIEYEARYVFVTDETSDPLSGEALPNVLVGLVSMRSLILTPGSRSLGSVAREAYVTATPDTDLDTLSDRFEKNRFEAIPVVDALGRLLGVVQRLAVLEAYGERAEESLLKVGGIIGGEELRTMPTLSRLARRLMFLGPICLLMLVSASVIGLFKDTIERVPIVAAFLPVVAGLSGSGGMQAVAVSMRELSLGLIRPADCLRVVWAEGSVGMLNGVLLGTTLGAIVSLLEGNPWLGVVVGGAVPVAITVSCVIGGSAPLLLQRLKLDPAMVAGPMVTTVVDLTAFLSVLALTSWLLPAG